MSLPCYRAYSYWPCVNRLCKSILDNCVLICIAVKNLSIFNIYPIDSVKSRLQSELLHPLRTVSAPLNCYLNHLNDVQERILIPLVGITKCRTPWTCTFPLATIVKASSFGTGCRIEHWRSRSRITAFSCSYKHSRESSWILNRYHQTIYYKSHY